MSFRKRRMITVAGAFAIVMGTLSTASHGQARPGANGSLGSTAPPPTATSVTPLALVPGKSVSVTGSALSTVVGAVLKVGCTADSAGKVRCPGATTDVRISPTNLTDGQFSFVMPEVTTVGNGAPLVLQLTNANNATSAFGTGLVLDASPSFVVSGLTTNGAMIPGQTFRVTGRNLKGVTRAFLGPEPKGSSVNPALIATATADGFAVDIAFPANCDRRGPLVLETGPRMADWPSTQMLASPVYVTNSMASDIRCGPIKVTSISPLAGTVGTWITLRGEGFNSTGGLSGYNMSGTPRERTSDTEMRIQIPAQANTNGVPIELDWSLVQLVSGAAFPVAPKPVFLSPPTISSLEPLRMVGSAAIVEPGQSLTIAGNGFLFYPHLVAKVFFGATEATITSMSANSMTVFVPGNVVSGPLKVVHAGGTTESAPMAVLSGPTTVSSIVGSLAESSPRLGYAVGESMRIAGANLLRATGLCWKGGRSLIFSSVDPGKINQTNDGITFNVPDLWGGSTVEVVVDQTPDVSSDQPQPTPVCQSTGISFRVR